MSIKLNTTNIVIAAVILVLSFVAINQHFKGRKTDKILQTIEQLQKERAIDSTRHVYIMNHVDSLQASIARQQIEIVSLKGNLYHEKKNTKQLQKSVDDLLYIISERPSF